MEANELRINNIVERESYLFDNSKVKFREIVVDKNDIYACAISPEKFRPIPITEEWMLKFGFTIEKDGDWIYFKLNNFIIDGKNKNTLRLSTKESKYILYIHELQNLYFALEGKELTIKK